MLSRHVLSLTALHKWKCSPHTREQRSEHSRIYLCSLQAVAQVCVWASKDGILRLICTPHACGQRACQNPPLKPLHLSRTCKLYQNAAHVEGTSCDEWHCEISLYTQSPAECVCLTDWDESKKYKAALLGSCLGADVFVGNNDSIGLCAGINHLLNRAGRPLGLAIGQAALALGALATWFGTLLARHAGLLFFGCC